MFETKNDLPEATRVKAIELLNARLADAVDLQTQTKQAHWNVKGPQFIALHELFDKINEDVEDYVDEIAERAVQLPRGRLGRLPSALRSANTRRTPWTAAATPMRPPRPWRPLPGRRAAPSMTPTISAISIPPTSFSRDRQVVVVRRGAPAGRALTIDADR